ncbi:hypothetical protein V1264_002510 [Littorina saxatilis]|uniref:Reverse transcriptase domain-containing protein n=1 Tax=Littorina saxatilis TaxID=31220 RepID=A0AAN9B3B3_9CAEN
MIVQGNTVACQVDCGASVNIIPARHAKDAALKETKKNLFVYNGTVLKPLGKTDLCIKNPRNGNNYKTEFIVIKENLTPLLGKKLSEEMGLITVTYDNFESVSRVDEKSDVLHDYSDVFSDSQRSLPGVATFKLEDNAVPVISASCRVPQAMKSKVEAELNKLTKEEIIAPVEEPTSWCSRMVVATKKSGKMRVCIDLRPLNKALKQEHYPLPVMEDLLPRLSGAKVFSKLDLRNAYWHVHLDKESSLLTTFQTPFGRYRWKRVPFGTSVSSELFQKRLDQALEGLRGVIGVSDEIIVYGEGEDDKSATEDHDINLTALLNCCKALGMRINPEKAEFQKKEISFLGHLINSQGLPIDPEKVEAVLKMPKSQNVEDVRRFCGFVNYLSKFLPKLPDTLEPIRQLTRQVVQWTWTPTHDKAFTTVQKLVTEAPVLSFFNPQKPLTI